MSEQVAEATFVLQRVYVKDLSFESPGSPEAFLKDWKPNVALEMNVSNVAIDHDNFEVTLGLNVTAVNDLEEIIYLIELQQSGIFEIRGATDEVLAKTLGSSCPNVLFPYAREALDAIVIKGSFRPLILGAMNFDAIYAQAQAKGKSEGEIASIQ